MLASSNHFVGSQIYLSSPTCLNSPVRIDSPSCLYTPLSSLGVSPASASPVNESIDKSSEIYMTKQNNNNSKLINDEIKLLSPSPSRQKIPNFCNNVNSDENYNMNNYNNSSSLLFKKK